ncbi:hypothetical protein AAG570_012582, partial [Ranatra chinensis]
RQRVLRHHPDKRKAKGELVNRGEDYFACITKAWEILGDKDKRKSYDSVDPYFDDSIPINNEHNRNNFFEVFGPVFKLNARWSEKKPVPLLGGPDDSRDLVDNFYRFWYNYESWREFSYEDEESKDRAQDRDERRWIERQNKSVRAKKKKEEMIRLRNLVDQAYNLDPRIAKFKSDDKAKKEAYKKAKANAAREKQLQIEKAQKEEDDRLKKEKIEEEAAKKAKQIAMKAEREAQKKHLRKERKLLRDICKSNCYFTTDPNICVQYMEHIEKMCEVFTVKDLENDSFRLEELNNDLKIRGKDAFEEKIAEVEKKLEEERQRLINSGQKQDVNGHMNGSGQTAWPQAQINLLIKAVNLFPAGTSQRWEVVANFINQHSKNSIDRTAKEVLSKAKELQNNDDYSHQLKKAANQKAYQVFEKEKKAHTVVEEVETSQRFESVAEQQGINLPWTAEEQKLLEQALKTYPSSRGDRWDQIAACIPTRSKKDCMKRYKELVEMVKAKKAIEKNVKAETKKAQ